MIKKSFIELADIMRATKPLPPDISQFRSDYHIGWDDGAMARWTAIKDEIADFYLRQDPNFNHRKWMDYINGKVRSKTTRKGDPLVEA